MHEYSYTVLFLSDVGAMDGVGQQAQPIPRRTV